MSYGEFLKIQAKGENLLWKRLALGDTRGRNEAWLRDLLQSDPRMIPVGEIDPSFGPLIPLCTELRTPAGPIDNAFIDHRGRLTLIECKLWRNPESRRKVVAQILDYAKELGAWSHSDLQREFNARTGSQGASLHQLIKQHHPELSEHAFADSVTRSLRAGRFLLLVAGDGIREDALALGGLLNRNVTSGFSFGMFEVALYANDNGDLLVQPRPIVRTQLIERTIVVRSDGSLDDAIDTESNPAKGRESPQEAADNLDHKQSAEWWDPVLHAKLNDPEQLPFYYRFRHNVRGPLPWPGTWILAYRASGTVPTLGVYLRGREVPLSELLRALEPQADEILAELPEGTEYLSGKLLGVERRQSDFKDDNERRAWLMQTINQFVNALRWRVVRLMSHPTDG